jgi:P pilus assembly chaperone PapD
MRWGIFPALLLASPAALAGPVALDVAPTTLQLTPGKAGLFAITNHGADPVTVQIEATDWRQDNNRDVLSPSDSLFVSPPLAHIAAGAQQSVRVLARPAGAGEAQYRLVVSQLPDAGAGAGAVNVLLQFRVPVFAGPAKRPAPQLAWSVRRQDQSLVFSARNLGPAAVKLTGLKLGAKALDEGLVYILPGASHDFLPVAAAPALRLTGEDALSGSLIAADISP